MRYLPHTDEDIAAMLAVVGVPDLDALFGSIPADCRMEGELRLPAALNEWELDDHMDRLAGTMAVAPEYRLFIGAGSYDHHIPATVSSLAGRSEFLTSYTPYQPEMLQGTLQGIYEYQTLTARLLGMEVATASHYDGATALAEALLMAVRITGRKKVVLSRAIHPHYREVVRTYLTPPGIALVELPVLPTGQTDLAAFAGIDDAAALAIQSPNFFGCIENLAKAGEQAHAAGALSIAAFTEALAFGLLKSPGSQGADIVAGEGQSFGIPRSFGGPALGMLASRKQFMRSLPGRLVGRTKDRKGREGFVLTLATREQHIRREKATSNICSNNSLCALTAAMTMASLGRTGMRTLAALNHDKAEYLKVALRKAGCIIPHSAPTFNEFVVTAKRGFAASYRRLLEKKIVAGLPLAPYYPELAGAYLLCATETASKAAMDELVKEACR
ncbi:MAG: aminomethyl-transferring glycine dehydrogenase subunit GcvPA [Deltaproteobacteria bacterium]|nr:aminomethyl-transferring glycine dehydrogenase subunit GcvPA [Deltaproteobacteria bacterium]